MSSGWLLLLQGELKMQNDLIPKEKQSLIVRSEPIELVVTEDGGTRLALVLPPFEDLTEISKLAGRHFSLREQADRRWEPFKAAFSEEFERLERKKHQFGDSKTFITHLANLAELAGARDTEYKILLDASRTQDAFVKYRIGENLQARGRLKEAEEVFLSSDLSTDTAANLRVAFFHAQRAQLDEAAQVVARVLAIDPLDYGGRLFEGALRLAKGQHQEAIQSFRIAAEERPTSSVLFTNMAIAYICARKNEKALTALRKAVALDPLNHNAVAILADMAHSLGRDEDAVPSLRYFVSLEQRLPSLWGRLARALLQIGRADEALAALRRQASQEDTSAVWNNMGVAHVAGRNRKAALSAFKHAVTRVTAESLSDGFLAIRNTLGMLVEDKSYEDVIRVARMAIADDREGIIRRDKKLGDIYVFLIHSLRHTGHTSQGAKIAEELLLDEHISFDLRIWLVTQLLAHYAVVPERSERAIVLAREYMKVIESLDDVNEKLHQGFINNLVFAFAETGQLEEATSLLPYMANLVHHWPYPTATLGLIRIRKGHLEKGAELYEEAIHLATGIEDKRRIRQKLNLEMGLHLLQSDHTRAERLLRKVESERNGSSELRDLARSALLSLNQKI
jgi:tetratricopeptide (TPR) repeat protein